MDCNMNKTDELLHAIIDGEHDANLAEIFAAIRDRQQIVRTINDSKALATIKVGDKVVLKGLSPKYLNGAECEVVAGPKTSRSKRISVKLLDPKTCNYKAAARFGSFPVQVPVGCVEKVN